MAAYKFRIFALIVIALLPMKVIAQSSSSLDDYTLVTIESKAYPRQAMWSNDSLNFVFFENISLDYAGVNLPVDAWIRYNINSKAVTRHKRWPLQPELTEEDLKIIEPITDDAGEESLLFESPDGRFVVCVCYGFKIFDRVQQTWIRLNNGIVEPFKGPDHFRVFWSGNSEAFILLNVDDYDYPHHYLISNNSIDIQSVVVRDITSTINNKLYRLDPRNLVHLTEKVYDISDDGEQVLFFGRYIPENNPDIMSRTAALIVWNTSEPDASYVLENVNSETVISAGFLPNSDTELWIVNKDGLAHYDLTTSTYSVIDSTITASEAYFSPDGNYLALICCWNSEDLDYQVTILDLQQLVPAVVPTPTAEE